MSGHSLEEFELLGDSKYRAYVAAVDKTLRNFENTSEWADLISTLGKLNKVLLSHMKYPVVPRRITISKRLAQCMHPCLPSGVHLKALETYDIIFKCMGTNRLSQELFIYSAGLFPLFGSAAMNVRSALLTVYETHFVPLGARLSPGLNGFLSGILAGLEEGSDHLQRTSILLTRVAEGVGQAIFFGCLWECIYGNSSIRLPAITHITQSFNKKLSTEDQLYILGTNIDGMVSALSDAMQDSNVLVQRAALDLTLMALPMHNTQLLLPDLTRVLSSAVMVLLRRDMSLNRRLYGWLMGSEINLSLLSSEHPLVKRLNSASSSVNDRPDINAYFDSFSRPLLVSAVICCLRVSEGSQPPDLRPYRLIVSLLDKPEIGPYILDDIFLDLLRCLYHSCQILKIEASSDSEANGRRVNTAEVVDNTKASVDGNSGSSNSRGLSELTKQAILLFSALEPSFPWMHLLALLKQACKNRAAEESVRSPDEPVIVHPVGSSEVGVSEVCILLQHLLVVLPMDTQQHNQASRLPHVLSSVTSLLTQHIAILTAAELSVGLELCQGVLAKLIPSVTVPSLSQKQQQSSRPSSRTSMSTLASLQINAIPVGTLPFNQPTNSTVKETPARESPPSDSGIVQIGVEANEEASSIENQDLVSVTENETKTVDMALSITSGTTSSYSSKTSEGVSPLEDLDLVSLYPESGGDRGSSRRLSLETCDVESIAHSIANSDSSHSTDSIGRRSTLPVEAFNNMKFLQYSENMQSRDSFGAQKLCNGDLSEEEYESATQSPYGLSPLHSYVLEFEKFFLTLVQKRILKRNSSLQEFIKNLYQSDSTENDLLSELKLLLYQCLLCHKSVDSVESNIKEENEEELIRKNVLRRKSMTNESFSSYSSLIELNPNADLECGVFKTSCNLLVDLSSIPTTPGLYLSPPSHLLPQWLVGLLSCIVAGKKSSVSKLSSAPSLTMCAIGTLLELVALAGSELSVWRTYKESDQGVFLVPDVDDVSGQHVQHVHIAPLLLPQHTHLLLQHTHIFQYMSHQLWGFLAPCYSQHHVVSTELLLELHRLTLARDANAALTSALPQAPISVVERQILNNLTALLPPTQDNDKNGSVEWSHGGITTDYDYGATTRWMTLWQVSKNLLPTLSSRYLGFDRCMFLMVEHLRGSSSIERSLSHRWLTTTLGQNDTARLIDPILVLLLHPHTRRVSVQHVNIEKVSSPSQEHGGSPGNIDNSIVEESQIYAISSEGGEVMYHLTKESQIQEKQSNQGKRVFALSSITKGSKKVITKNSSLKEFEAPSSQNMNPLVQPPMIVMVNPFCKHPWIDIEDLAKIDRRPDISNAVRIQNGSYQRVNSIIKENENPIQIIEEEEKIKEIPTTPGDIAKSIVEDIIDNVFKHPKVIDTISSKKPKVNRSYSNETSESGTSTITESENKIKELTVHPLHSHMLLYMQVVDSGQCLNGLILIRNIIECEPKMALLTMASTSISSMQMASPLMVLLARHRRSVFGEGFDGGVAGEMVSSFRSTMYLEVVITVCLYYLRSFYPCLPHLRLRGEHLRDNQEVQGVSAEVLVHVFTYLRELIADSPRGFTPYITDLLSKCKVQKCVLHCLFSTVHAMKDANNTLNTDRASKNKQELQTFTEEILEYNSGPTSSNKCEFRKETSVCSQETYLTLVIDLTLALIILEDKLWSKRSEGGAARDPPSVSMKYTGMSAVRYQAGQPIPAQPMFMQVVVIALSQRHLRHTHAAWLNLCTSALTHMGPSLPTNCLSLTSLLCDLLESLAQHYEDVSGESPVVPPDHVLLILQSLTTIVHFCLLDTPSQAPAAATSTQSNQSSSASSSSSGQILYNLLHVFSPVGEILDAPVDTISLDPLPCARHTILSHLPRIISALLSLWEATSTVEDTPLILGSRRAVRQHIVELLSPICHHHTPHLLAAVSVVWQAVGVVESKSSDGRSSAGSFNSSEGLRNRRDSGSSFIKPSGIGGLLWSGGSLQLALVEMMSLLRVLPLHNLVGTVKQVVKQPPVVEGAKQTLPLEVCVLQFFYVYVQQSPPSQLGECWEPLLSMAREGPISLSPPAQLVLLATLNEFVQRAPSLEEKKDVKDLQDVTGKLIESCSNIAGSCLEATTWLRRNLTVRADTGDKKDGTADTSRYSVAALSVLAELLAPLLDVLYVSEEKEKVVPMLTNIMAHVIPYLKNHYLQNMSAFMACSQLLSSLAGYQYTVRAWRKDVVDLLLDAQAFCMLPNILPYWRTIVDYLCTHDKTVFKELLTKVSMSQGGSLNLFHSKESEYELRAGLLKRLAFVIFCSETDQYIRHIPDIQERLSEVTRLGQVVPGLVAQVLLCFRVLLLRMSPRGVTSLWPVIITELVQVFLMMEQELATDTEQFSSHLKRLSTLDSSWVVSSQNGLNAHNHPAWLTLYLAACKLLDLMLALTATHLPQFQMYRWAFVGHSYPSTPVKSLEEKSQKNGSSSNSHLQNCEFVPHIARIAKLMTSKAGSNSNSLNHQPGCLLLTNSSISTLMDLQPFFNTLISPAFNAAVAPQPDARNNYMEHIERVLERDFLEALPT